MKKWKIWLPEPGCQPGRGMRWQRWQRWSSSWRGFGGWLVLMCEDERGQWANGASMLTRAIFYTLSEEESMRSMRHKALSVALLRAETQFLTDAHLRAGEMSFPLGSFFTVQSKRRFAREKML